MVKKRNLIKKIKQVSKYLPVEVDKKKGGYKMKTKMKALIIINETHSMMDEQKSIIEERYQKYEVLKVPSQGWNIDEILDQINKLHEKACEEEIDIVFVSPIPLMIRELTEMAMCPKGSGKKRYKVKLFHNDRREKKELPDGRIISVVAQTGWQLV